MVRKIYDLESVDINSLPVRCKKCRKAPKLCTCAEYRIEVEPNRALVYADSVATEPVRGENVGTWQARKNARIWRRPQFVDGILVGRITNLDLLGEVREDIDNGTFHVLKYAEREGFHVPDYDKTFKKRFPIFRAPRSPRTKNPRP